MVIASPAQAKPSGTGWFVVDHFTYLSDCQRIGSTETAKLYKEWVCEKDSPGYLLWARYPR
jgi:hypothetical protein